MPLFMRSPQAVLVLILALPVASIAIARGLGLPPAQSILWYAGSAAVCIIAATLRLPALSSLPTPGQLIDEQATERILGTLEWVAAVVVDIAALLVAMFNQRAALLIVAAAIAWVALWSIPQLRRTRITSSFVIRCSPEAAFTFVSDLRNLPQWRHEVESMELLTPEPIGPGSRFRGRSKVPPDGSVFDGVEEIGEYEPNRRFTTWVSSGLHPNLDEFTFDPVDSGTLMTQRFDFEYSFTKAAVGGLFTAPYSKRLIIASRRSGEMRLKRILEV
jgi:hypothetical protein